MIDAVLLGFDDGDGGIGIGRRGGGVGPERSDPKQ